MQSVNFSQIGWSGDLASWLDWVASSSRKLTAWPAWDFCPIVQQLAWRFKFWHAWHVCTFWRFASHEPPREIQSRAPATLHNLEHLFTLSHILLLHESHLNTRLLIAKIQTNLVQNKANKMVDKIQPYIKSIL